MGEVSGQDSEVVIQHSSSERTRRGREGKAAAEKLMGDSNHPHTASYTTYANTATSIHAPVFVYAPIQLRGTKISVELGSEEEDEDEDEDEPEEHSHGELAPAVTRPDESKKGNNQQKGGRRKERRLLRRLKEKLRHLLGRD